MTSSSNSSIVLDVEDAPNVFSNYERIRYRPLHKAIHNGDWKAVNDFRDRDPEALTAKISWTGKLPIHVAAESAQLVVAEKLIEIMSAEDLEIQTSHGLTVLHVASSNGSTKIVELIIRKNSNLLQISSLEGHIPVLTACMAGHKETTHYLYSHTPPELFHPENGAYGSELLNQCIISKMYDIALDLLRRCPLVVLVTDGENPLMTLAREGSAFPSTCQLAFWERLIYSGLAGKWHGVAQRIIKVFGIKQVHHIKDAHFYILEILKFMCETIATSDITCLQTKVIREALFEATKNGIVEFVVEMIKANPEFLNSCDGYGRTILMASIAFRREKIFNLVHGLDSRKYQWISSVDHLNNNILHWVGKLEHPYQLEHISGAALRMQRELQWYKEVESMVQPSFLKQKNDDGNTPHELFSIYHKEFKIEGEKWMKQTASSSTVIATLILTIMFTAAFNVPGGNVQGIGIPVFLPRKSFMVFIIADAISLFASSTSVLMFLAILTSPYAEEDFLKSLPRKLIIGLSTLFISITTMTIAFSCTLIMILKGRLWAAIPIILLAGVPLTFVQLQFPLLVEIFVSTYGKGIFDKKVKRWY